MKEILTKPVISVTKASVRKLNPVIRKLTGMHCEAVVRYMTVSKKKFGKDIAKAVKNTVHIINKINDTNLEAKDLIVKSAHTGKYLAFRKIRRYAKGRASFGKSYISRFQLNLEPKNTVKS